MNYLDDENNIIHEFHRTPDDKVYFPNLNDEIEELYISIHDYKPWKKWIYSAGKNDPPPDYYNDDLHLMMDVMRVDDHTFIGNKDKPVNYTNAGESKLRKELENSGILENFHDLKKVIIIPKTNLSTEEDHNYLFYRDSFKRVIEDHISKIDQYKKNHLGYKIIFFIMDESSAYMQVKDLDVDVREGNRAVAKMHYHFMDKAFLDVLVDSEIDYVIWFTPYKHAWSVEGKIDLPQVVVSKVVDLISDGIVYEVPFMKSVEV